MYLKALEIVGFKSFPDKTKLTFEPGLTAVVGPNGSGKSNISDAVRWVLGEQSAKTLRIERMEDIVFNGTSTKKPLGFAQTSLVIDNSDRALNVDSDEVTIYRKYYRSGESDYGINGRSMRLKDINEVFMDTGLGKGGYSIVGQGKIAEIIGVKSEDRRAVFEEAAGIAKFRYKKSEAERRLYSAQENILRLEDIVNELEARVGPLKIQSEKAKKFLDYHEKMKFADIALAVKKLENSKSELTENEEKTLIIHAQTDDYDNKIEKLEGEINSKQRNFQSNLAESDELRELIKNAETEIGEYNAAAAVAKNDISHAEAQILRHEADIQAENDGGGAVKRQGAEFQSRLSELEEKVKNKQVIIDALKEKYRLAEAEIASQRAICGDDAARTLADKKSQKTIELENLKKQADDITFQIRDNDNRIKFYKEQEASFEGFQFSVKAVLHSNHRGVLGTVAQLIEVDRDFSTAVETALGGALQNIVVEDEQTAKECINFLKTEKKGRATFLPLTSVDGTESDFSRQAGERGFIGNASELVRCDRKFDGIICNLLGRILIVEDIDCATAIARKNGYKFKIVTLDGQVINAGGSFTGGSAGKNTGILSRKGDIETLKNSNAELREKRGEKNADIDDKKAEIARLDNEISELNQQRQNLNELIQNKNNAALEIAEARNVHLAAEKDFEFKQSQYQNFLRAVEDGKTRLKNLALAIENERGIIEKKRVEIEDYQLKIVEIKDKSKKHSEKIDEFIRANRAFELETAEQRRELKVAEHEREQLAREKIRLEEKRSALVRDCDNILLNLTDEYDVTRTEAYELVRNSAYVVEDIAKTQREISELRSKIAELGTVNVGAIEEYKEVSQRYEFLFGQLDDAVKAKRELENLIANLTNDMKRIFSNTFRQINANFQEIFVELFGGGKAELVLENPDDVLECGIEINVAPPGKVVKNLMSLSGGEQSFVAISIFFAMLKLRPSPFCVLDEIDAALDETNVRIYSKYLRNFTDKTQFILVTHRRGAMEEADSLYGVTMQEDGISKLLKMTGIG